MYFKSCNKSDNAQKWFFVDKGLGFSQIINVNSKFNLECSGNNAYLNSKTYDNDYQLWTSKGRYLRNKAFPDAYLTNNNGNPAVSSAPYQWNFEWA